MSDDADRALAIQDEHLGASLRRINAAIPTGVKGECDECGEIMLRLVGGRCGYCRDGRRPPLSRFDEPAAPIAPVITAIRQDEPVPAAPTPAIGVPVTEESDIVPTAKPTPTSRTISVPASGAVLAAIERRAQEEDLPWGRAVVSLLEDALAGPVLTQDEAVQVGDLAAATLDEIFAEVRMRLRSAANADLVAAAVARAESAERQLATIKQVLSDVRPQA